MATTFADPAAAVRAAAVLSSQLGLSPELDGSALDVTVDDGPRTLITVLRVLDEAGLAPVGLTVREPSLDDVFLSLTGHRTDADAGDPDSAPVPATRGAA